MNMIEDIEFPSNSARDPAVIDIKEFAYYNKMASAPQRNDLTGFKSKWIAKD